MKKRIVIKLGGSALNDFATLHELAKLIKGYQSQNFQVVLVHGGGPAINAELIKRGIDWKFVGGQRQTTPEMMFVIEKVLAGEVNQKVVGGLRSAGIPAVGLSGGHDRILLCKQANTELQRVGEVQHVSTYAIEVVLRHAVKNVVPVIAPVGVDQFGDKYNVNADWAATQIAAALKAEKLVFLTDQFGILNADEELIKVAAPELLTRMIDEGVISGGMSTKVKAMMAAQKKGIKRVQVLHAKHASLLLENETLGTAIGAAPKLKFKRGSVLHEHAKQAAS